MRPASHCAGLPLQLNLMVVLLQAGKLCGKLIIAPAGQGHTLKYGYAQKYTQRQNDVQQLKWTVGAEASHSGAKLWCDVSIRVRAAA